MWSRNSRRRMDSKMVTHTDRIANSALNYIKLDETKIRSKVIAELHVKQIGASINCLKETSNNLTL